MSLDHVQQVLFKLGNHLLKACQSDVERTILLENVLALEFNFDDLCDLLGVNLGVLLHLVVEKTHLFFVLAALLHKVAYICFLASYCFFKNVDLVGEFFFLRDEMRNSISLLFRSSILFVVFLDSLFIIG